MKVYVRVFCILLLSCSKLAAQNAFDSSLSDAVAVYSNVIGTNLHLYNGSEYIDYDHRIKGTPFFNNTYFSNGSIVYDGILYNNVQLFYDVINDNVIIRNYNNNPLLLNNEKVTAFNVLGHQFISIKADSSTTNSKASGFFDVLYDGKTKLIARRKKELTEKITTEIEASFDEKDEYYILKGNVLYGVNNKRTVLNIIKDRKQEIEKFIHQGRLKFKKENLAPDMIKTVAYYDSLKADR